jgi:uncharacterized protein YceH (UPF0502 family)
MSEFHETEVRTGAGDDNPRNWQPLDALQRRVLGVLVEKAKTTPDAYPMSVNAIRTGCNQKNNRHPQMDLDADDVQATLDELREMGAVVEVQGDGRVVKYRHRAYEWLGVDKTEMAVMTELLLRGEQTVGELRGRAARMEPIGSLAELRPIIAGLVQRGLVVEMTPEGRGQMVTHGLYPEGEVPEAPELPSVPRPGRSPDTATSASFELALNELRQMVADLAQRVERLENRPGNENF